MTTTKPDPKFQPLISAIKKAHVKARAPGVFLALLPESDQYFVQTGNGAVKHRYNVFHGKLTVFHAAGKRVSVTL